MARDKKASFRFTTVSDATGTLGSVATSDKLGTVVTYSGSKAYTVSSDVLKFPNMIVGDAAGFAAQADTAATGSSDLIGINGQNQTLYLKLVYTNNASVSGAGSPTLTVQGSDASSATGAGGKLDTSNAISPATVLSTTVSTSKVVFVPIQSNKPYWQVQISGTTSTGAGTVTIVMAALVTGRDGSVSI
jgi:hypothetical protein